MRRPLIEFNLTEEQLSQMFGPSNDLTIKTWEKRWLENITANLLWCPNPKPMRELLTTINRHVSVVVGAGPSVRKLKKRAPLIPPDWGVITTDHSLLAVLDAGLKPTLVVTMDGHQETEPILLEGFTKLAEMYPDVPVLTDLVTCPSVVELIKNPYWFRSVGDANHILTKYVQRECPQVDQIGHGGNVGSVCCIMSKFFSFSRHVCLIGFDNAMQEGSKRNGYWYGRTMPEDHCYLDVCDIYGRPLTTMANLHNYKWWLEHFCHVNDDVEWINCNDGGFLGVADQAHNFNHFKYLPLERAVEHLQGHGEDD